MDDANDHSFFGHPRGLGYIAFAEAWERFSYYGMQALLVLYMVNRLLHPGHVEHIAGFIPFRHAIESLRGPLAIQPLASTIFGLYTGLVYLTPIAGGLIADRWLGRHPHHHHRGIADVGRTFLDGVRCYVSTRAYLSALRRRLFQRQPRQSGRRALPHRG